MRRGAVALVLAASIGCSGAGGDVPAEPPPGLEGVRRVHDAYPAAWLAGDPEAVMRCFTPDAVLIPHHGLEPVAGEAAIRAFFWPPDEPPVEVTRFSLTAAEIESDGDTAWARGRFDLGLAIRAEDGVRTWSNRGNYLMIFRRETGEWRIVRSMWNDPPTQSSGVATAAG